MPAVSSSGAGAHVLAGAADVVAGGDVARRLDRVAVGASTSSWGITAVAPAGTVAPVETRIASPLAERVPGGVPGAGLAHDRQRAGRAAPAPIA